jgi:hypothetical protein
MTDCLSLKKFFYGKESERIFSGDDGTGFAE